MKPIHISGTRKKSVARVTLREGTGIVKFNRMSLDTISSKYLKLKLQEPLIIAGDVATKVDIDINAFGGGSNSQAEAARLAIARALALFDRKLESQFSAYDRHLLIADVRQRETHKPNRQGNARAKRQKSYR